MLNPHQEIVNDHEFWMLPIQGGHFLMGSPEGEGDTDERPQHKVAVSDFHLGKFPVTQALWRAVVMAANAGATPSETDTSLNPSPSNFQGDESPVEQVSWDDAQAFIKMLNKLTESSRPTGYVYRLPTEAEWEYAARGGKFHGEGCKYAGSDRLKDVGWFKENSGSETKPVGLKYANQLGLYDMSGNVFEWCEDAWHSNYGSAPQNGSAWIESPERGSGRVFRGGSWLVEAQYCRVAYRGGNAPGNRWGNFGFRLALSLQ